MEYVRRLKLTKAGFDLQNTNERIIDIALKYGYDSPMAFNRAFKNLHGVAPSKARNYGINLVAYPKITFHISIKGDEFMNYRIEQKDGFNIIGVKETISTVDGANFIRIPQMWQECNTNGTSAKVMALNDSVPDGLLGVCANLDEENNTIDYYIAAASNQEAPVGMEKLAVQADTWAIFESVGPMPNAIQEVWKKIFTQWFPTSGYIHGEGPELEVYFDGDTMADDYRCEVWIPVIKE